MNNQDKNPVKIYNRELPGLLDTPGNSPQLVREFFEAAAQFYRAAPWMRLHIDQPLAVTLEPPGITHYLLLIGAGGYTVAGLIVCHSWEAVQRTLNPATNADPADQPYESTLTFVEAPHFLAADHRAMQQLGVEVAAPHAYPLPLTARAGQFARPNHAELVFFTAALHAVPAFASGQLEADETGDYLAVEAEYEVQVEGEPVRLTLRYPANAAAEGQSAVADVLALSGAQRQAAALGHEAWNEPDPDRRIELARQALDLSPDAADAYTVLAEEADYPEEARAYLEKAVAASEALLTPAVLDQLGDTLLWEAPAVRPFLRARLALAETLEQLGRPEEALRHYLTLLELNPADHPGARYPTLALLVRLKRDTQARALIERYKYEEAVDWEYTRALLAFREHGNTAPARRRLQKAVRRNPVVADFLSAARPLPLNPAEVTDSGVDEEAYEYALRNYPSWWGTPGAVNWLKKYRTIAK